MFQNKNNRSRSISDEGGPLSIDFLNIVITVLNMCILFAEKELLTYKMKGKDGILTDEDSDGKWNM